MLLAKAIIENKNELDKCVTNLLHEKDINVSFRDNDVFVDKSDTMLSEMLLQTIKGISSFTPEVKYSSGISIKVNPVHFKHGLDIIDENEPFVIYIYRTVYKIVQKNCSSISPLMGLAELDDVIYRNREIEDKIDSNTLANTCILESHMEEVAHIFKKISDAESNIEGYEKLFPFYTLRFDGKHPSIGKGDVESHFLSIQLAEFDFSGEPIQVQVSDKIEKTKDIFNPDKIVAIKCHNRTMIHFSQDYSPTMKIDFFLGVMTK